MNKWEFVKYKLSNTLFAFIVYLGFLLVMSLYAQDNEITKFCLNTSATIAVGYLLYRQGEKNAMSEFTETSNMKNGNKGPQSNDQAKEVSE